MKGKASKLGMPQPLGLDELQGVCGHGIRLVVVGTCSSLQLTSTLFEQNTKLSSDDSNKPMT